MGSIIEKGLTCFSASMWTNIFIALTLVVFVIACHQGLKGKHSRFLEHAPNVMTSLGILGTFIGIVIGLLQFNPTEIDTSISLLLEGLKTAFVTSLVGMFASIIFKSIDTWVFAPKREAAEAVDDTPKDFYGHIEQQTTLLEKLCTSLAGEEEGSLTGGLKLLRADLNDATRQRKQEAQEFAATLWGKLDDFAKVLSKSATEQVIEALKNVIIEFNEQLTEQFGDNFKALDASVKKLVDWQQQYMQQLATMSEQYDQSVQAISATEKSVTEISEKTSVIPQTMENLATILESNDNQIKELKSHLEVFVAMRDSAIKAVPEIQQQVTSIGMQFQQGANAMKEQMVAGANDFKTSIAATNEDIKNVSKEIKDQVVNVGEKFREGSNEMKQQMVAGANDFKTSVAATNEDIKNVSKEIKDQVVNVGEKFREGSNEMKQQMVTGANDFKTSVATINEDIKNVSKEIKDQVVNVGEKFREGSNEMKQQMVAGANDFKTSVATTNEEIKNVSKEIKDQVANVGEKFRDGTNEMKQAMSNSANEFKTATREFNQSIADMATEVVDKSNKIANTLKNSINDTTRNAQTILNKIDEYTQKFNIELQQNLNKVMDSIRSNTEITLGGVQHQIKQAVENAGNKVNETVSLLDRSLQQELNRALGDLGRHLGRIAAKIVEEYEKMQSSYKNNNKY
jgi:chromosome segregation ATPase